MKLEELAVVLARDMGRGVFIEPRAGVMILQGCLRNAELPADTATVIRLQDMIENLCEEAWCDWQEKRDAQKPLAPPSTLASFLREQQQEQS